jgi:hypothetical protein
MKLLVIMVGEMCLKSTIMSHQLTICRLMHFKRLGNWGHIKPNKRDKVL